MVETISPLTYAKITGRFLATVADSDLDGDPYPDGVPLSGSVTFTPSASAVLVPNAVPDGAIVFPTSIVAELDQGGYIVDSSGNRGIYLVATDNADTNPVNFTYLVTITARLGTAAPLKYAPFSIAARGGTIINLVDVAPIPTSGGNPIIRNETAAINAQNAAIASAAEAKHWAEVAQEAAGSGGSGLTLEQVNTALIQPHISSGTPHPAYDNISDLITSFENGLA